MKWGSSDVQGPETLHSQRPLHEGGYTSPKGGYGDLNLARSPPRRPTDSVLESVETTQKDTG